MEYRNYFIDTETYGMITVQYEGDDIVFGSTEEAKEFIDSL